MKLSPKSVEGFLSQPTQVRAALIYGPDSGLVRERAQRIAAAIVPDRADPFANAELTEEELKANPTRLAEECAALSLLGGKRVVILRDVSDKYVSHVKEAVEVMAPETYLVVFSDELTPRSALRKLFEEWPTLAAVPCYKDEGMDLEAVIRKQLEVHGLQCGRDVVQYLAAALGNDRYVTYSEIEKIALYKGEDKRLTLEDVQAVVDHNKDSSLEQLCNAVASKDPRLLDRTLQQLLSDHVQPILMVRSLTRYFERLYVIKMRMAEGEMLEQIVNSLRPPVFFKQAPVLKAQAERLSMEAVVRTLGRLSRIELQFKTASVDGTLLTSHALLFAAA